MSHFKEADELQFRQFDQFWSEYIFRFYINPTPTSDVTVFVASKSLVQSFDCFEYTALSKGKNIACHPFILILLLRVLK